MTHSGLKGLLLQIYRVIWPDGAITTLPHKSTAAFHETTIQVKKGYRRQYPAFWIPPAEVNLI